jgi:hypothetical protein
MLRYVLITVLPRMSQFGYHIGLSILSVFTASLMYTIWSCSSASHLVPPAADIEMSEVNADLTNYYETRPGENEDNVDDFDSKAKN